MHVNPHIGCVFQYGGIENRTFTFYHVFSFFHLDFCLRSLLSLLSAQTFVCVAFCLRGRLSTPVLVRQPLTCCFVTAAFCLRGLLSSWTFVCAAYCLRSLCGRVRRPSLTLGAPTHVGRCISQHSLTPNTYFYQTCRFLSADC
jgi:hypothetical protein